MDNETLLLTENTFDTVCAALDERRWYYEKDKENYTLNCKANGKDLMMEIDVSLDVDKRIVMILSRLPFTVPKERRDEMAEAICMINHALGEGCFDYHVKKGTVCFRMTSSYRGSVIAKSVFDRMIVMSFATVDQYNDKIFLYSLGAISLDELRAFILS